MRGGRERPLGLALGEVVAIDSFHVPARNNLGVLAAGQEKWDTAIRNLSIAAFHGGSDTLFDNLDQAIAMAEADGYSSIRTDAARNRIQEMVRKLHERGQHTGQTRWGNQWVSIEQYNRYIRENKEIDRQITTKQRQIKSLEPRYEKNRQRIREYERIKKGVPDDDGLDPVRRKHGLKVPKRIDLTELKRKANEAAKENKEIEKRVNELRGEIDKLAGQRHERPHAGRLVMVDARGSQAGEVKKSGETGGGKDDYGDLFD
jgi:hypothetical protein